MLNGNHDFPRNRETEKLTNNKHKCIQNKTYNIRINDHKQNHAI
jgi:hypothetical protein